MNQLDQGSRSRPRRVPFEGDLEAALASHMEYDADWKLLLRERERLLREYPESWVACANGKFYNADNMFELFRQLRAEGLDYRRVPAEFITHKKLLLSVWP